MTENIIREGSLIDYLTVLPNSTIVNGWGEVAHGILRWYNRESGAWVISFCDAKRQQVGDSIYIGSGQADAKAEVERLYRWAMSAGPVDETAENWAWD
jgi:hypothetical protein